MPSRRRTKQGQGNSRKAFYIAVAATVNVGGAPMSALTASPTVAGAPLPTLAIPTVTLTVTPRRHVDTYMTSNGEVTIIEGMDP